jgi:3-hydroxybutyryl-CoA dehydrogenase
MEVRMGHEQDIKAVAVVGAGCMGLGIAQVLAQAGYQVSMHDTDGSVLDDALTRIRRNLNALCQRGLENSNAVDGILSRIAPTVDLAEAVRHADFVTESIPERLEMKQELFAALEELAPPRAILASNTSMLMISEIGEGVRSKHRLVITHWFNPPHLIPVVEVVRGLHTSAETVENTVQLLQRAGKVPIRVMKEVPGHLINRIQFAIFREAIGLMQDGVATPEDIDRAISGSLGLRFAIVGPLKSIDLTGIDKFWLMRDIYRQLDSSSEPQQIIREKIEAGHVGRTAGKGFFDYDPQTLGCEEEDERDDRIMSLLRVLYPKATND